VRPKTKTNQPFDILQSGGLNHHNADLGIPLKGPDPRFLTSPHFKYVVVKLTDSLQALTHGQKVRLERKLCAESDKEQCCPAEFTIEPPRPNKDTGGMQALKCSHRKLKVMPVLH
jgi:hypothetical protein